LSAGRVQSVALRLICEREKEINSFVKEEYWSITANLKSTEDLPFEARLHRIGTDKAEIKNESEAKSILSDLEGASYKIINVQKKEKKKNPVPPFITSTLQQEASRKLRFSAKKTMMIAQKLYEGLQIGDEGQVGLITYMRTDSFNLSSEAVNEARNFIASRYGSDFLPDKPNFYKSKKTAQEAHEAIRPTSVLREPSYIRKYLEKDAANLYELIWNRFVACQMNPAILDSTSVDIEAKKYLFRATGSVVRFPGFLKVYEETIEVSSESEQGEKEGILPH